jgi:hypothetical protein
VPNERPKAYAANAGPRPNHTNGRASSGDLPGISLRSVWPPLHHSRRGRLRVKRYRKAMATTPGSAQPSQPPCRNDHRRVPRRQRAIRRNDMIVREVKPLEVELTFRPSRQIWGNVRGHTGICCWQERPLGRPDLHGCPLLRSWERSPNSGGAGMSFAPSIDHPKPTRLSCMPRPSAFDNTTYRRSFRLQTKEAHVAVLPNIRAFASIRRLSTVCDQPRSEW